jgi:hypothetical protein
VPVLDLPFCAGHDMRTVACGQHDPRPPMTHEIRVRGRLGRTMRAAFPGLRAETHGEDTLLTGALTDQAALYGVLAQIEALGLELLEVRRLRGGTANHPPV